MRIIPLKRNDTVYSCYSYLILGDWNHIGDLNTVIDPGTNDYIFGEIEQLSTGVGKSPVDQVILTHNHFDHAGAIKALKERYNARVLAFCEGKGVDDLLCDGQFVKAGDSFLEVLHTPGHSSDSICLYAPSQQAIFAGDTQVRVNWPGDDYDADYIQAMKRVANRDIRTIYTGHDVPLVAGCHDVLLRTLRNIGSSQDMGSCCRSL